MCRLLISRQRLYKHPLWLAVCGQRRDELGLIEAYQSYVDRYDIEHFFRFGKQKLLMSTYQTPELTHEQDWWQCACSPIINCI